MAITEPTTTLATQFSSSEAAATPWSKGREQLERAEIYWISTVRPDGRPHVTPLIALWFDDALYFCTGPEERKAKNLAGNSSCVVTTGCNVIGQGLDIVVEGDAVEINDESRLGQLADEYKAKYGWEFTVQDGAFYNDEAGRALVFGVTPATGFGFGKGEVFSQTRWRFR